MKNYSLPIVIDLGSENCRVGFSGEDAPRDNFPTVVGHYKMPSVMIGQQFKVIQKIKDIYIGDEAYERRGILNL